MHPYESLPARSFWRSAVAEADLRHVAGLWTPAFTLGQDDPVLTAGSCFAGHLGPALLAEGMRWYDAEPAPPGLTEAESRARHYGRFSFRTGDIYTAAALRQWLTWAFAGEVPPEERTGPGEVWSEDGRHHDPFRPAVEPDGYATPDAVRDARRTTLAAIRDGVTRASCLIFTLGLTEAWLDRATGLTYAVCPGTVRGTFDAGRHVFHNFTFSEVHRDLSAAVALARRVNPGLRVLLTVSPVPLTATATGGHALTASTYSKSVLRAVAGQLAQELDHVDYFPSYEIVTGFPFGGTSFGPDLRSVTPEGVALVMRHFFAGLGVPTGWRPEPRTTAVPSPPAPSPPVPGRSATREEFRRDDAVLDYYHRSPVPPAR
ncbi:GSCFA domain-containing protein [Streptomyces sp. NPDC087420]|uniref:GSCFA domain-containing protein n=1 Tax=Streptomyces sp. NPDC087420 TaxID=3365785 RepID=UPI0038356E13